MKMIIDDTLIAYLEELSRLHLSDAEKEAAKTELSGILAHIDLLGKLDTADVETDSHLFGAVNVFREDIEAPSMDREQLLANAPVQKDGCFQVPRTVEG